MTRWRSTRSWWPRRREAPISSRSAGDAGAGGDQTPQLRAELARVEGELAQEHASVIRLRSELTEARAMLEATRGSLSWRVTKPLRVAWDFLAGLRPFLREMRGFPRRARYTISARGLPALLSDIRSELSTRLQAGSLAAPAAPPPAFMAAAELPLAARGSETGFQAIRFPNEPEPRASIVIPAYNQFARTFACLASILERTSGVPYEVIVVDDGSEDETRELERLATGVLVVRNNPNLGFIESCNRGAEAARGEFVVFLNNDTLVSQGWLTALLEPFEDEAGEVEVGLVGAKLVYPDGRLQEAGGIIFSDGSGWNYGRGDDPANPKYEFRSDADYCSGACIAIRRELFHSLGGFDLRFVPMYYEDVDLAFSVRASGRRVVYQPTCTIIHCEGGTAGTDTGSGGKRYQVINQKKLLEKWGDALTRQPAAYSNPDSARYRSTGPHVLVLDSYTPRPDNDAGSLRMENILYLLRRLGCRVTFLPENRSQDGKYTRRLQDLGVEALYHPYVTSLEAHLKAFGDRYDMVIMSRVGVASEAMEAVRRFAPGARRVFDTVDLHFLREARQAEVQGGRSSGNADQVKTEELQVARDCDVTLVVSSAEEELLAREAPDLTVEVLSLITTTDPTDTPFSDRSGIIFIGNFQHPPNCDATEYYLRDVHPKVRERLPEVTVTVIGANAPRSLTRLSGGGVQFVGQIEDIRPDFSAARLSVAPLRFGAGIKGKINTSLGFGVPVVTTTVGAEGMNLRHGEHILIADDPDSFAEAVVTLYSDAALWVRLAENGQRDVGTQFSVENAERTLARLLGLDGDAPKGRK